MRLYVDQFVDIVLLSCQSNLVLKIIYTPDMLELQILFAHVKFVFLHPLRNAKDSFNDGEKF